MRLWGLPVKLDLSVPPGEFRLEVVPETFTEARCRREEPITDAARQAEVAALGIALDALLRVPRDPA